ncbi:MAG: ATP-binding protein [Gemmatimonadaceae bacterium]
MPSDVREIERVVDLVRRACEVMQFDSRQLQLNVPVALTEALSNAILRGNADDPRKHVRVHARVDRLTLVIEVTDEGAGFDMDACTIDPTTPDHLLNEDGRGLFLMQKLMDSVERFSGRPGNVVRLTLRRAS